MAALSAASSTVTLRGRLEITRAPAYGLEAMNDATLIGRERELAEIEAALASARTGDGGLVPVSYTHLTLPTIYSV